MSLRVGLLGTAFTHLARLSGAGEDTASLGAVLGARGGRVDSTGRTYQPILGPRLDGVSTAAMYCGLVGSLMSKILTPSQRASAGAFAGTDVLLQELSDRCESVPRKSRSPCTETSFWAPGRRPRRRPRAAAASRCRTP